jgi:hypothetical protein
MNVKKMFLTKSVLVDVKWFVGGELWDASPVISDLIYDAIDADLQGSIGFDVGVKYTF